MSRWLLLLIVCLAIGARVGSDDTQTRDAGRVPPVAAAAAPPRVEPYRTLADIPRGAWFRGLPPAHWRDVTAWEQVQQVDPPWVRLHGGYWLPEEMAGRFEWTADPFVPSPITRPCTRAPVP